MITLCQFCLDRQIPEPGEAIAIYQKRPICDTCWSVINENLNATQVQNDSQIESYNQRKESALRILDKLEELYADWPLTEHEVLLSRDDFFNHRPPALINMTVEQIKKQISFRKAILFAHKIKDERWTSLIDSIRSEERRAEGLLKVTKSVKEVTKKSKAGNDQLKKLAKAMGVSIETLEKMGAAARQVEFGEVIKDQPTLSNWEEPKNEVKETLKNLQNQIKAQTTEVKVTSSGIKRCLVCGKLTCICKVK